MNNTEIKQGIEKYYELVRQREKQKSIMNHFLELEKDPKVLEYIELLRRSGVTMVGKIKEIDSDEKLAIQAFGYLAFLTEQSNNIYVYMGPTFKDENCQSKFHEYKDLETTKTEFVFAQDKEKFEENHTVIFPECKNKEYFFNKARGMFLSEIAKYSTQEEAKAKVLVLK